MPLRAHRLIVLALLFLSQSALAFDYDLEVVYTGDVLSNVSGGVQTGTRYMDNLDVILETDVAGLWGAGSGKVFLYGLYYNGPTFSDEVVGDLQVISNIDAIEAWRLYEAWYEWRSESWSVRSGLYDLNSEFDVKGSGAIFLNSSHGIGAEFSQSGRNGPGIFPVSSLAVRVQFQSRNLTARLAVLDGFPGDPDRPTSNAIDIDIGDGALIVAEVDAPLVGDSRLWAGYWIHSTKFERPFDQLVRDGNASWYIGAERQYKLAHRNAAAYIRYGQANENFNPIKYFVGLGAVLDSPFKNRPNDQVGLGMAMAGLGAPYKNMLNMTGYRAESRETILELTYRTEINEYLALQPDGRSVCSESGGLVVAR